MSGHRSTAWPLSGVAAALVVYATLHPLTGWHWPDSQVFSWVLPKLPREIPSDMVGNLLGYMPMGLVLCVAWLRSGWRPARAALLTLLLCSAMSYTLELVQFTVPGRVPSITDWLLNTLGAAWGALAAVTLDALGLIAVWSRWRERWFIPQAGFGLALLCMWPLGLLFPPPFPLGEGQILPHLRVALVMLLRDTPWQQWVLPHDPLALWTTGIPLEAGTWEAQLREGAIVCLGLLAPMTVACAFARPRTLRLLLLAGAVLVAVTTTTLSTAMNFGPEHALTWMSVPTLMGLLTGSLAGALLLHRSRRACAVLGLCVLLGLVVLIHQVPPDPYYAQTLASWENGRFIRFHGLARWFGVLWPYVALGWLIARILGRDVFSSEQAKA